MNRTFELLRGGAVSILESDGNQVLVLSDVASPPGSTLEFRQSDAPEMEPCEALQSLTLRIKVRSCRRDAQTQRFRIEGRFVNLPRTAREQLLTRP
jgi:hypothetical protein